MPTQEQTPEERHFSVLAEVSNTMVRIHKDQFGRGPTHVRTDWCSSNVMTVILDDTLTPAERNLAKLGEHQRLRDTRILFQYAAARDFCGSVETITGRKVRAFLSGVDTEANGVATEVFVFHPPGYDGPSRTELLDA